jgi:hypothetical protein
VHRVCASAKSIILCSLIFSRISPLTILLSILLAGENNHGVHPRIIQLLTTLLISNQRSATSDLKPWVVSGLSMEGFQRVAAPEVRGLIPYCPFKADVFALGFIYYEYFRVSRRADCPMAYVDPVFLAMRTMARICNKCHTRARGWRNGNPEPRVGGSCRRLKKIF